MYGKNRPDSGHDARCETARTDPSECECSCEGRFHGDRHSRNRVVAEFGNNYLRITESMGGEIADALRELRGVYFECFGHEIEASGPFYGYPHNRGVPDENGNKYWVFLECPECGYHWSWHKIPFNAGLRVTGRSKGCEITDCTNGKVEPRDIDGFEYPVPLCKWHFAAERAHGLKELHDRADDIEVKNMAKAEAKL